MFQLEQSSSDAWWCDNQPQVVGVTALAVFHQVIFNSQEKRLTRTLGNLFKKVCRILSQSQSLVVLPSQLLFRLHGTLYDLSLRPRFLSTLSLTTNITKGNKGNYLGSLGCFLY